AAVAGDGQVEGDERARERAAGVLREVRAGGGGIDARDVAERAREALGQAVAQKPGDGLLPERLERGVDLLLTGARQEVHGERRAGVVALRVGEVAADVHAGGPGDPEVREQERVGELREPLAGARAHEDGRYGGQPA